MNREHDLLVVGATGSVTRWIVHRPRDHHGDGSVHTMLVEVSDEGIVASSSATLEGQTPDDLCDFIRGLAKDWRGWPGTRSWTSMEGEMTLDADHDGTGHVSLAVTIRRAHRTYAADAWSARVVLTLEAGEELSQLAQSAERGLRVDDAS